MYELSYLRQKGHTVLSKSDEERKWLRFCKKAIDTTNAQDMKEDDIVDEVKRVVFLALSEEERTGMSK